MAVTESFPNSITGNNNISNIIQMDDEGLGIIKYGSRLDGNTMDDMKEVQRRVYLHNTAGVALGIGFCCLSNGFSTT